MHDHLRMPTPYRPENILVSVEEFAAAGLTACYDFLEDNVPGWQPTQLSAMRAIFLQELALTAWENHELPPTQMLLFGTIGAVQPPGVVQIQFRWDRLAEIKIRFHIEGRRVGAEAGDPAADIRPQCLEVYETSGIDSRHRKTVLYNSFKARLEALAETPYFRGGEVPVLYEGRYIDHLQPIFPDPWPHRGSLYAQAMTPELWLGQALRSGVDAVLTLIGDRRAKIWDSLEFGDGYKISRIDGVRLDVIEAVQSALMRRAPAFEKVKRIRDAGGVRVTSSDKELTVSCYYDEHLASEDRVFFLRAVPKDNLARLARCLDRAQEFLEATVSPYYPNPGEKAGFIDMPPPESDDPATLISLVRSGRAKLLLDREGGSFTVWDEANDLVIHSGPLDDRGLAGELRPIWPAEPAGSC